MGNSLAIAYQMKKKAKKACHGGKMASGGSVSSGDPEMNYAEGGRIGSHQSACDEHCNHPGKPHEQASGYAKETHPVELPTHQGLTDSGEQSKAHEMDMVGRVMRKMSKGGQVANDVGEGQEADKKPNEFDDLVLRDDLEFSDSGANSGDEDGGPSKDDVIARAMMKKKAKR